MTVLGYTATDAGALVRLAELAGGPPPTYLGPSWQLVTTIPPSPLAGGGQGFSAFGPLPSNPSTTVAVLALGATWASITGFYGPGDLQLTPLPNKLLPASNPQEAALASATLAVRRSLQAFDRGLVAAPELVSQAPIAAARSAARLRITVAHFSQAHEAWRRAAAALHPSIASSADAAEGIAQGLVEAAHAAASLADGAGGAASALAALHGQVRSYRSSLQAAQSPAVAQAQVGAVAMMEAMEQQVAAALTMLAALPIFKNGLPLVVTGQGVGGPIAQLAALFVRPGNTVSTGVTSPVTDLACYAFSSPMFGNQLFQQQFAPLAPNAYTVNATGIDFFASAPTQDLAPVGALMSLSTKQPIYDSPWKERTAAFYAAALSGSALSAMASTAAAVGAEAPLPPIPEADTASARIALLSATPRLAAVAYDANLAFSLSVPCAVAYQRFQHPNLITYPTTLGYLVGPDIEGTISTGQSATWATVFYAQGSVVVAFRGSTSFLELVQVLDDPTTTLIPSLSKTTGSVLNGIGTLYQSLRQNLFQAVAKQCAQQPGVTLYFTGHDVGGALASIAALDVIANSPSGIPAPTAVYGFGCPQFADWSFTQYFNQTVPASFQVARPADVAPSFILNGGVFPIKQVVPLPGGEIEPFNGNSSHSIDSYIGLLNPYGAGREAGQREVESAMTVSSTEGLASKQAAQFADALAARNIRPSQVPQGTLDTASMPDGILRLGWSPRGTLATTMTPVGLDGRKVDAYYAQQEIRVRSGQALVIDADNGHRAHLIASRLVLEPGARVQVYGQLTLNASELVAPSAGAPSATFEFVGQDGGAGNNAPAGMPGANGAPGMPGGMGASGGAGGAGTSGGAAPGATLALGVVSGTVTIIARGGLGGRGGTGGAGGAGGMGGSGAPGGSGGNGGPGGPGGNGGSGSSVTVTYQAYGPEGIFVVNAEPAQGGLGGPGGAGGLAGAGHPDGRAGAAGSTGTPGAGGLPSTVQIVQRG